MRTDTSGTGAAADVVIRRADPSQWAACRRVRLAALADAPDAFSSTLERELAFDEQAWRQRLASGATFLAWQDGEPVGTASGVAADLDPEHAVPGSRQLVGMWVDPAVRGLRVADRLVEAVAAEAKAQGAARLVLWVTDVNGRARAFYQRMGFRPTGVRDLVRPDQPDRWEEQLIRDLSC
ncbi:MAG TPA: GNAT family N-acetyltransferase [Streptosporangiaceae bacterium]|nr:GNAT family N-acetyltransferase [Streptosporangiaceae bacterium]